MEKRTRKLMNDILQTLIKPLLEKIIEYIDKNEYWFAYGTIISILLLFVIIGFLFSWFLNRKKLQKEIDKIQIETKEKKVHLLEKLQKLRTNFIENSKTLSIAIRLVIDSIKKQDIEGLRNNRDELQTLFFNDFVNSFTEYMEIYNEVYPTKGLEFIDDEIMPFLNTVITFKESINNRHILQLLEINPLEIELYSFNQVKRFLKNNIPYYRLYKKYLINKTLKEITSQRS